MSRRGITHNYSSKRTQRKAARPRNTEVGVSDANPNSVSGVCCAPANAPTQPVKCALTRINHAILLRWRECRVDGSSPKVGSASA